jgi:predicted DNA-binding protein YlxM (UPF0122 family)
MTLQRPFASRRGTGLPRALDGRTAVVRLFDAYAGLLTERQQGMLRMYYHEDLSLGEIAARAGVTRQAVFDSLRRSVSELWSLEERVGVLADCDRQARARQAMGERLAEVERLAAKCADTGSVNLGALQSALRALREML